jgi:hypothetical protein
MVFFHNMPPLKSQILKTKINHIDLGVNGVYPVFCNRDSCIGIALPPTASQGIRRLEFSLSILTFMFSSFTGDPHPLVLQGLERGAQETARHWKALRLNLANVTVIYRVTWG